jgi:nitric oxide reductase subunit B
MHRKALLISKAWFQIALLTFVLGFGVLGYLAWKLHAELPPVPGRVVDETGQLVWTAEDVMAGQHLFQRLGLMEYGTIFGHGAYLGPDFTAEHLHAEAEAMIDGYRALGLPDAEARARSLEELKTNRYDPSTDTLVIPAVRAAAFRLLRDATARSFGPADAQNGLRRPTITDPKDQHALSSFFSWASWVAAATRPGRSYSFTNNWPPEPLAGNEPTPDAFFWSAASLVALLGGTGIVLFVFGRYGALGWQRSAADGEAGGMLRFRDPEQVRLTPSQRATPWYFLVVGGLFLAQGLLGGVNAHYHAEPGGFYGLGLASLLPYNLSRMWHLQLALFFVSTSFLAMGIFLAPLLAGREPRGQKALALLLFGALVLVVCGSLAGEALSLENVLGGDSPWFWLGAQGWEYLDLGRLWQILLAAGMVLWVVILARGLWSRLPGEHRGGLPYLFLYSALSIPLFYAAGLVFGKMSEFAIVDFWRFWVVHLWVEDFLELFTTIMVACIFVLLGAVRLRVALTVVYLDIILYSVGGVVGTMHHLYFSGAPSAHMAFGAFFSAMEVVPLMLLSYEAWRFTGLGGQRPGETVLDTSSTAFPHKWAVMFLVAVGFWNFLGAGVFGFLINLPVVSYYEIGTAFTANHGHAAMMGVYGNLAMGFLMFVARYFVPRDPWSERAMRCSFWSLNLGLLWMVALNLVPVGALQFYDAVANGYWHARQAEFFTTPLVRILEWTRLPGDVLFIVGGIVPVVYLGLRMFARRGRPGVVPVDEDVDAFTQAE